MTKDLNFNLNAFLTQHPSLSTRQELIEWYFPWLGQPMRNLPHTNKVKDPRLSLHVTPLPNATAALIREW